MSDVAYIVETQEEGGRTSDVAYIMETQDPCELWLVEGENKYKVSRDMYWLLVGNGADLPPTYHITELLAENAKLRELVRMMWEPFCWAQSGYDVCLTDEQDKAIRDLVHELDIKVGELRHTR